MTDFWSFLLQTLTASGAAAVLLVVKAMFRDKLSPRWQFAVWGILAVMLLLSAGFLGRYSLVNWPIIVEVLKSALTGRFGTLTKVTAPVPLPPLGPPETVWDCLYLIYAAGAVLLLARYLAAYIRLRLALRRGRPVLDGRVREAAARYGLPVCAAVKVEGLPSAFVCGVLRPVLALPAGRETDEKVLLHELLHLKYHDAAWGLVICFFRCLHWCNPLLWQCANLAGNDLESLCDQRVLERLEGEDRRDYGRILLDMANEKYARAPGTSSMANGGRNIRRRIQAIARFKRYPAGMALVSVCVALVLACPMVVGARAEALPDSENRYVVLAAARTTRCTTYAGAFDAYAKAMLTGRTDYRALCAPLAEQDTLAQCYGRDNVEGDWNWLPAEGLWRDNLDRFSGYQIYNLAQSGDGWEGLLALTLNSAPPGETWDSGVYDRWMLTQRLRAEKEGDRWVIVPQGELRAMQGDIRDGGNIGLPAWEYTAPAGDFTLRVRWQTTSAVESGGAPNWFSVSVNTAPILNGEFTNYFDQIIMADYTGAAEDKAGYESIGVSYVPLWAGDERPVLQGEGGMNGSGSSSDGEGWGQNILDWDWGDTVFLVGDGGSRGDFIDPPERYAADLYLNGKKAAELTLLPSEGGGLVEPRA